VSSGALRRATVSDQPEDAKGTLVKTLMESTMKLMQTAALIATLSLGAANAAPLVFTTFLEPGATSTAFWDVNNNGSVTGFSTLDSLTPDRSGSFIYSGGTYTHLPALAGAESVSAFGISDGETVVGTWQGPSSIDPNTGETIPAYDQGFIYSGGAYTTYNIPGAFNTHLRAISPNGRYVSGYYQGNGVSGQGFVLDTLNSQITLVGAGGNDFTLPQGINNAGVVVGGDRVRDDVTNESTGYVGFTFDVNTGVRNNYVTSYFETAFRAIDENGVVSGWLRTDQGDTVSFTGGFGLNGVFSGPGSSSTYLEGSNDRGVLVGIYYLPTGESFAFVAAPVPEPSAWLLMCGGLIVAVRKAASRQTLTCRGNQPTRD
jgi:hypothetical protein